MDGIGLRLLVFLLIFVAAEAAWSALRKRRIYNLRDSLANLAIAGSVTRSRCCGPCTTPTTPASG